MAPTEERWTTAACPVCAPIEGDYGKSHECEYRELGPATIRRYSCARCGDFVCYTHDLDNLNNKLNVQRNRGEISRKIRQYYEDNGEAVWIRLAEEHVDTEEPHQRTIEQVLEYGESDS
jgi:hypothetical protein